MTRTLALTFLLAMPVHAATATFQANSPDVARCNRLGLGRASSTFAQSIWEPHGWPLWRVTCVYMKGIA